MATARTIRWSRVVLGGFFIEATLFAIVIPLSRISQQVVYYSVPALVFISAIPFAYWVARPVQARFVLHGALTATAASALYVTLTTALGASVPLLFHLSHGLRILGGMVGGWLAERRADNVVPVPISN